jgi:DNA-binding winged helix-turn-helix (wHTH) protein
MSVSHIADWRLPGCTQACWPRNHDPEAHESYGYRQAMQRPTSLTIEANGIHIDLRTQTVTVDGTVAPLTGREWEVLAYLARTPDQWCNTRDLTHDIWGDIVESRPGTNIRITVARLRARLGHRPDLILNRAQFGYMLRTDPTLPLPVANIPERRTGGQWARGYDACQWCKRTDRVHQARGLCALCYERQKRAGKWI